jgi:hypothetical protein
MVSSVSKGWMANIADHSPFARRFVVRVVRRCRSSVVVTSVVVVPVVGWSVLCGMRFVGRRADFGQTKRPPGCPDGLADDPS